MTTALLPLLFVVLFLTVGQGRSFAKYMFAATCLAIALWIFSNYLADIDLYNALLWTRLAFLAVVLCVLFFVLFIASFPVRRRLAKPYFYGLIGSSAVIGLIIFSDYFIPSVSIQNGLASTVRGPLYWAFVVYFIVGVGFVIKLMIKRLRFSKGADKQRLRLVILATIVLAVTGSITNIIVPLVTGDSRSAQFAILTPLIFVAIITYAVTRHRLFDLKLVAARAVTYLLLLTSVGGVYGLLIFSLSNTFFVDNQTSSAQQFTYIVLAVLLAFTFQPLKKFFDSITDAIFFRRGYNAAVVLEAFGDITVSELDLQKVSHKSLAVLEAALKPDFISLYVVSAETHQSRYHYSVGRKIKTDSTEAQAEIVGAISRVMQAVVVVDYLDATQGTLHASLTRADISLIVRLETSKELIGYLFFGAKQNGGSYTSKDVTMLTTAGDELALAVQNSLRFEEIQAFNATLQQKIADATTELRHTNKKLKELDRAKDEFISMASHQLRTPLTSIKGYISMTLEGDGGTLQPAQTKLLNEAFLSSERMVHLIGDFLNLSRLRTGRFVVERSSVDIAELVAEEVQQLRPTAATKNLKLNFSKPATMPSALLDDNKIRQVVMNFIDNAIYYTPKDGTVEVELTSQVGEIIFKVKDNGIGVPKNQQHHLFSKFFRADNAKLARPDGTGIGLFMAKKAIVAHSGALIFESKEGKGSTFGFRLPLT